MKTDLAVTGVGIIESIGELPTGLVEPSRLRRMDPLSVLAVAAARLAAREAGLDMGHERPNSGTGVAFGTAYGCQTTELRYAEKLVEQGAYFTNPIDFPDSIDGAPAAHVAMELGLTGPSITHADGDLAYELALVNAALAIQHGRAERMLVGAGDTWTPLRRRLHAECPVHPATPSPPEGAVFVVLEPQRTALARKARVFGLIVGVGLSVEAGVPFGRLPTRGGAHEAAIARALASAGLTREGVDSFQAVATGRRRGAGVLARVSLARLRASDARVVVHHAVAAGGQSVALVLAKP